MPDTRDTSATRATWIQHECDTTIRVRQEWDTSVTPATRVRHKCYTNSTSATLVKNFDFDNETGVKKYFHTLIFTIWQVKKYMERNNFILCFLATLFSKNNLLTFGIFNESNIWAKVYHIWGIWFNYCCNYGPSKLLLQFIEYRLDELNNKHTKIAILSNTVFWRLFSKKMSAKSFVHPPQNGGPVKFLRN